MLRPFHGVDAVPLCVAQHLCHAEVSLQCVQSLNPDHAPWCFCDRVCRFFDDCCLDYKDEAHVTAASLTTDDGGARDDGRNGGGDGERKGVGGEAKDQNSIPDGIPHSHFVCTFVGKSRGIGGRIEYGYWLVSFCPNETSPSSLRSLCELSTDNDTILKIPVSGPGGVAYRNIYCALCNGEDYNAVSMWTVEAYCGSPRSNTSLTLDFKNLGDDCNIVSTPKSDSGARFCFPGSVSNCAEDADVDPSLCDACRAYTAVVEGVLPLSKMFRNPHCALSYGVELTPQSTLNSCDSQFPRNDFLTPQAVPSFSILIDFKRETVQSAGSVSHFSCPLNSVFDPFTDQCRILRCTDGEHRLRDGQCVPATVRPRHPTSWSEPSVWWVLLEMNVDGVVNCSFEDRNITQILNAFLVEPVFQAMEGGMRPRSPTSLKNGSETVLECRQIDNSTSFVMIVASENDTLDMAAAMEAWVRALDAISLDSLKSRLLNERLTSETGISLRSVSLMGCHATACEMKRVGHCTNEWSNETSRYPSLSDAYPSFVKVNNAWYLTRQTISKMAYYWSPSTGSFDKLGARTQTCDGAKLRCAHVSLDSSFFEPAVNLSDSLLYIPSGLILASENYTILRNGSVLVCSLFDRNGTREELDGGHDFAQAENIISMVGSLMSIVGAAITFVTYSTFPSLRNHIRCPLLNLTACLIVAYIMFLLSNVALAQDSLCIGVAFLGHFFWLAASSWSNVIAVSMNRAFTRRAISLRHKRTTKNLCLLHLYAFGVPCCISFPCLVLAVMHDSGSRPLFSYRGRGICWIHQPMQILFSFSLPITASALANVLLFAHTVYGIRHVKMKTKLVKGDMSIMDQAMEELPIYLKISSLMGFCWVVGFLATITDSATMRYIFYILMASQGVAICLSFCNRRVWGLWKERLRSCSGPRGKYAPNKRPRSPVTVSGRLGGKTKTNRHSGDGGVVFLDGAVSSLNLYTSGDGKTSAEHTETDL